MPDPALDFNHNQPIYSVSELSLQVKRAVEDRFGIIRIRGEISGWKQAASGHVYFRMKDENAVIDAVCWRGIAGKLPFKAEDGLEVICTGKITTYPGRSSYQIIVDHIEPAGVGALMAILEKRKAALAAEGLFAAERKKTLPFLPETIGVITSPTGAVIRDILHRLEARFPVHVIVWPVAVQGEGAAEQIATAIKEFNSLNPESRILKPDLLIVARGGGSIEDLWAFNEEIVVRAAAASRIPLISAVGHETDTTLIDFASDLRAPTPTAAAELAIPVLAELKLGLAQMHSRMGAAWLRNLAVRIDRVENLARGLPKPQQLLQLASQRLDDFAERLIAALPLMLERKAQQLALATAHLKPQRLLAEIQNTAAYIEEVPLRMTEGFMRLFKTKISQLESLSRLLESVNYQSVLARGFALVRDAEGKLVSSVSQAKTKKMLSITFKDGEVKTKIS